jgi:hypothetical protein
MHRTSRASTNRVGRVPPRAALPAALSFLAFVATACAHTAPPDSGPTAALDRVVIVTNQGASNVDVYAVRLSARYHIGFVSPNVTAVLRVPAAALEFGDNVQILLHQVGDPRVGYTAGTVHLDADETAELTIAPTMQFSTLSVRMR